MTVTVTLTLTLAPTLTLTLTLTRSGLATTSTDVGSHLLDLRKPPGWASPYP